MISLRHGQEIGPSEGLTVFLQAIDISYGYWSPLVGLPAIWECSR